MMFQIVKNMICIEYCNRYPSSGFTIVFGTIPNGMVMFPYDISIISPLFDAVVCRQRLTLFADVLYITNKQI